MGWVVAEGGWVVHALCLMPNHYHLLCETPHGQLSRWMRLLNGGFTRRFNARHGRVGHLWQGRYKALLVEDGRYFLECGRYIHLNPNRSRLTRPAERYPWSSYRGYVGAGLARAEWVCTERTLSYFDGDGRRYRAFVEAGKGEKPISPFERAFAGLVLGGEAFVERIRRLTADDTGEAAKPALAALRRRAAVEPEAVEAAVQQVFASDLPRRRRRLLLYAMRKHTRLRPGEIARRYGRSPAAVTLAVRDLDNEAASNPELAAKLEQLPRAIRQVPDKKKTKN